MQPVAILFEFISFLLAMLAAFILFFVNKEQQHTSRVLAAVLWMLALTTINAVALYSGWFLYIPWLHKMATPFSLLIYPLAYLYIRSVLKGDIKFRKYDWLLLIPAILYAINLVPYYLMPIEEKRVIITAIHKNSALISRFSEGIFPAYVFSFVRFGWSVLFIILNFRLLGSFKKQQAKQVVTDNKELLRWLYIFNSLLTALVIAALVVAVMAAIKKTNYIIVDLTLGISSMIMCIQLFLRPKLLYGVFQPLREIAGINSIEPLINKKQKEELYFSNTVSANRMQHTNEIDEPSGTELTIIRADSYRFKKTVETLFLQQKPFLQIDYSLEQLVKDTGIPRYILSSFINREYGMGFREFLNRYRMNFFIDNLNNPQWKNLKIEAIAELCGFQSRNTFTKNFKEFSGQTPSEFIKAGSIAATA